MFIVTVRTDAEADATLKFDTFEAALKWSTEMTEAQDSFKCHIIEPTEPYEIFWDRHNHTCKVKKFLDSGPIGDAQYQWDFAHPYVCCIHEPTKRGFYLDRSYRFICNVENIIRPTGPEAAPRTLKRITEVAYNHCAVTAPDWAEALPPTQFTSYWLY